MLKVNNDYFIITVVINSSEIYLKKKTLQELLPCHFALKDVFPFMTSMG